MFGFLYRSNSNVCNGTGYTGCSVSFTGSRSNVYNGTGYTGCSVSFIGSKANICNGQAIQGVQFPLQE